MEFQVNATTCLHTSPVSHAQISPRQILDTPKIKYDLMSKIFYFTNLSFRKI